MMKRLRTIGILSCLLVTLTFAIASCGKNCDKELGNEGLSGQNSTIKEIGEATSTEDAGIEFPYMLDGGKVVINSLFRSSIENPDAADEIGEDIASLEIENTSDQSIEEIEIIVDIADLGKIHFAGSNIPAGKKAWIFAVDNQVLGEKAVCEAIEESITYGTLSLKEEAVQVSVEDTVITLTNISNEDMNDVTVGCHCLFEEQYFGGITYSYPVERIAAGSSVTIDAVDCYLGIPDVVYIK